MEYQKNNQYTTNNNRVKIMNKEKKTQFNRQNHHKTTQEDNAIFRDIGQAIIEQERYLKNKTLIPNYHNFEKYLFVKKQLNKIAKEHNSKVYEEPNQIHSYVTTQLYTLDTDDFEIISKISKYCTAIGINADLNGKLTLSVTVPDIRLVYEEQLAQWQN